MFAAQTQKKLNWRKGLATTFAVAAFTATITNYAVWQEDILTDHTYTDDSVLIDDQLFAGSSGNSATDPSATISGEGDLTIYDGVSYLSFVDSTNANDPSWSIGQSINDASYSVVWRGDMDTTDGATVVSDAVMKFEGGAPADSIKVLANGDVSFDSDTLFYDASSDYLGIGTSTPSANLHLMDTFAWTRWEGTAGVWDRFVNSINGNFVMRNFNNGGAQTFVLKSDVGANALVLGGTGVGMGTFDPEASLEVERNDGSAKILIDENSGTTDKRRLLELENNGAASMLFTNSNTGVQWELNPNANDHFIINSVGIGGTEFTLKNDTGEMFVGGRIRTNDNIITTSGQVVAQGVVLTSSRETKEEFKPVDNAEILDKVAELEITQWRFKEGNEQQHHIGPMAEDFEEAFQLGTDGKTIGVTDVNGIALASIQALNAENTELKQRIEKLEKLISSRN